MVGAVIVTHTFIGRELIATAEYLVGKIEGLTAVSIGLDLDAVKARRIISQAIHEVDQGEGVLIMTDLFGGTPANLAFSFLEGDRIEVITGVNLPMILTFWNRRESGKMLDLASDIQLSGTRSIAVARDLMGEKVAAGRETPRGFIRISNNRVERC
jgi:mannose PTS system EIIA component